jgi:hypothetical protein
VNTQLIIQVPDNLPPKYYLPAELLLTPSLARLILAILRTGICEGEAVGPATSPEAEGL